MDVQGLAPELNAAAAANLLFARHHPYTALYPPSLSTISRHNSWRGSARNKQLRRTVITSVRLTMPFALDVINARSPLLQTLLVVSLAAQGFYLLLRCAKSSGARAMMSLTSNMHR
jgi:hypothetical protein